MKLRLLICTVLLALFVVPAFADSVTFTNQGGLSVGASGISANSVITGVSVDGMPIPFPPGPIGTLTFDTGALTGGSFSGGDFTFGLFGGDTIKVYNFVGTVTNLGTDLYNLVGTFSGTLSDGVSFTGSTNRTFSFSIDGDRSGDDGNGCLRGTTIVTTAVPEPSTLTFLGTGLIALAGAVRRKLGARV